MGKNSKFTDEQKFEIALDLISGKLSHGEICRKWGISPTYAYKIKDRALEILRSGIGRPPGKPDKSEEKLRKRVSDLEELAGRSCRRSATGCQGRPTAGVQPRSPAADPRFPRPGPADRFRAGGSAWR